jgi:aldehyde:ferredoxin oxidoreductase
MNRLLRDYYEFRQWDWDTGKPRKDRLIELGLSRVAEDLYPA